MLTDDELLKLARSHPTDFDKEVVALLAKVRDLTVKDERERCAKIAERTARRNEERATEPLRAQYSRTIAESDRATAVELRDVALLIREGGSAE